MERSEIRDLVISNQNLIYSIANKFRGDIEDLFQVGCIGLIKAFDNFDEREGVKFTTYAYKYIYGEIYKYVISNQRIKITPELVKLNGAINKAHEFLCQQFKREPSASEVANFLEIPIYKLLETKNAMEVLSLDEEHDDMNFYDVVGDYDIVKDDVMLLEDALQRLEPNERELILKRYFYNMTQSEIAKEFGINQVKVSRDETKVLSKLRSYM